MAPTSRADDTSSFKQILRLKPTSSFMLYESGKQSMPYQRSRTACPASLARNEHNPHRLRGESAVASTALSLGVNDLKHVTPTIQTPPTELAYEEDKTLRASPHSRLGLMANSLAPPFRKDHESIDTIRPYSRIGILHKVSRLT